MASKSVIPSGGLVTEPGVLAREPESLASAVNCDLSSPGAVAKRRGFRSDTLTGSFDVWSVFSSVRLEADSGAGSFMVALGDSDGPTSGLGIFQRDGAVSSITGTWASDNTRRAKLAAGMDGLDVLTDGIAGGEAGPIVLDYVGLTARRLGIPRGMGLDRQNTTLPAGTMLPNLYSVRYAVVFVLGDPMTNGAQFGAPGMTSVVFNASGATADVATRILLPYVYGTASTALPADTYWVQVYRSVQQLTTSGEPPSELALVYQKIISAADIAAGYIAFTDAVPDSLRGANLYTNIVTGEDGVAGRGFVNSNEPPPDGTDVVNWADCLWLSNLTDYPTQEMQLISVGGTGLVAGDTVTVDGVVYTGVGAAPGVGQFVVYGAGSASVNQRETALNICDAINRRAANTSHWAYYVAGVAGQPGRILLRGRLASSNLSAATSRAAAFRIGSQATDAAPNGVAFSKDLQVAAWPVVNRFEMGTSTAEVLRIVPYRDSLFVFKRDGLWRITGDSWRNFGASEFDRTFQLLAREAVAVVDDTIYAWGVQGIAAITDGGVQYIDTPIRTAVLNAESASDRTTQEVSCFAVASALDGSVAFFYPTLAMSTAEPTPCQNALVWYGRTRRWATWSFGYFHAPAGNGYLCGAQNVADGQRCLGVWSTNPIPGAYVHYERRNYDAADFCDVDMTDSSSPTLDEQPIAMSVALQPFTASAWRAAQWIRVRIEMQRAISGSLQSNDSAMSVAFFTDQSNSFPFGSSPTSELDGEIAALPYPYAAAVPQSASRSQSLLPVISNSTIYEGPRVIGVAVDYREVSARGVTR